MRFKHLLLALIGGMSISASISSFGSTETNSTAATGSVSSSNETSSQNTINNETTTCENETYTYEGDLKPNDTGEKILITVDPKNGILKGPKVLEFPKGVKYADIKDELNEKVQVTRAGVEEFPGWLIIGGETGSVILSDYFVFDKDCTICPNWKLYTVEFDAGLGSFKDGSRAKTFPNTTIVYSDTIDTPIWAGYAFEGWYLNDQKITKFPFIPSGDTRDITIRAKYSDNVVHLFFTAGYGGKFKNGKVREITVPYGTKSGDPTIINFINQDIPTYIDTSKKLQFVYYTINNLAMFNLTFYKNETLVATYAEKCTVTFDVVRNGGSWSTTRTSQNKEFQLYPALGYTFKEFRDAYQTLEERTDLFDNAKYTGSSIIQSLGWFRDPDGQFKVDDSEVLKSDEILYACYDLTYKVQTDGKIIVSGDTEFKPSQTKNLAINIKPNTGYTFDGQTHSLYYSDNGKALVEGTDYTLDIPSATGTAVLTIKRSALRKVDLVLKMNLNKIKYNINYSYTTGVAGYEGATSEYYDNNVVVRAIPLTGYKITKIFTSNGNTAKGDRISFTMPNKDVLVSCETEKITYNISIQDPLPLEIKALSANKTTAKYGDSVHVTAIANPGNTIKKIAIKNKLTGSVYKEFTKETEVDFEMPSFDVLIEAEAGNLQSVVSFDSCGGSPEKYSDTVAYGEKVKKPTNPVKANFVFGGWFTEKEPEKQTDDKEFDFNSPIYSNISLYARWLQGEANIAMSTKNIDPNVPAKFTLKVGEVTINKYVSWESLNTDIAVIDEYGNVTGVGAGHCSIVAKYNGIVAITNDFEVGSFSKLDVSSLEYGKIYRLDNKISGKLLVPARYYSDYYQEFITLKFYNDGKCSSSLKDGAFLGCKNIISADIASGIYTIGRSAFEECTALTACKLPDTLKYINSYAFYDCSALESIHIPASVKEIRETSSCHCDAFVGCSKLQLVVVDSYKVAKESSPGNLFDELGYGYTKVVKVPSDAYIGKKLKKHYYFVGYEGGYAVYSQSLI